MDDQGLGAQGSSLLDKVMPVMVPRLWHISAWETAQAKFRPQSTCVSALMCPRCTEGVEPHKPHDPTPS